MYTVVKTLASWASVASLWASEDALLAFSVATKPIAHPSAAIPRQTTSVPPVLPPPAVSALLRSLMPLGVGKTGSCSGCQLSQSTELRGGGGLGTVQFQEHERAAVGVICTYAREMQVLAYKHLDVCSP